MTLLTNTFLFLSAGGAAHFVAKELTRRMLPLLHMGDNQEVVPWRIQCIVAAHRHGFAPK